MIHDWIMHSWSGCRTSQIDVRWAKNCSFFGGEGGRKSGTANATWAQPGSRKNISRSIGWMWRQLFRPLASQMRCIVARTCVRSILFECLIYRYVLDFGRLHTLRKHTLMRSRAPFLNNQIHGYECFVLFLDSNFGALSPATSTENIHGSHEPWHKKYSVKWIIILFKQ